MKKEIKFKKNIQPWEIHYMGNYYDSDDRAPGMVPVDVYSYVLAGDYNEAVSKGKKAIGSIIKNRYNSVLKELENSKKIEAKPMSLENLIVARNSENDGRMGWISTRSLSEVQLSDNNYEFAVIIRKKR